MIINYGDITKIDGSKIIPVDVITGGSPCQDFSTAGLGKGLEGSRSSLFLDMIRVIKEMRLASHKPRFVVFENVPGILHCNAGKDFHRVLTEFAHVIEPDFVVPPNIPYAWSRAGHIVGSHNMWSLAWRVCNAGKWGVAQNRRRLMLLVDYGGENAHEILFGEYNYVCSAYLKNDFDLFKMPVWVTRCDEKNAGEEPDTPVESHIRDVIENHVDRKYNLTPRQAEGILRRSLLNDKPLQPLLKKILNAISEGADTITIVKEDMEGLPDIPFLVWNNHQYRPLNLTTKSATIRSNGSGCDESKYPYVVCLDNHAQDSRCRLTGEDGRHAPCITKNIGDSANCVPLVLSVNNSRRNKYDFGDKTLTVTAVCNDHINKEQHPMVIVGKTGLEGEHDTSIVLRNITPVEVERLFGYPDDWTRYTVEGRQISNAQRYKMLGNSIAMPQWKWLMRRLVDFTSNATLDYTQLTHGSLFDGIGGFHLCASFGGMTTLWTSEIDKWANEVTRLHLGGALQTERTEETL
jgi:site-specific DNA-cytosine methylase